MTLFFNKSSRRIDDILYFFIKGLFLSHKNLQDVYIYHSKWNKNQAIRITV